MGNGLKRVAKQCGGLIVNGIEYNKDGHLKHIIQEGSRHHVLYWDSYGVHCTENNCEINFTEVKDGNSKDSRTERD